MSLHRYLPTPSDRMGVIWTLLTVKDAVVLEYGPAGTTHFSIGAYSNMGLNTEHRIFTTHLGEDDIIMGDVTRLENAIREIDENYHPRIIYIVSSAVVSIIGADIKGVCKYMQAETVARLIPVDTGGFKGDYSLGLKEGWLLIVKSMCSEKQERSERTYNILGASPYNYRIKSDVAEVRRLMKEGFDMECKVVLGEEESTVSLYGMSKACINLVLQAEAIPAAEYLKHEFGTPYIYQAPYGYNGTESWLSKIAEILGKQVSASLLGELKERRRESGSFRMYAGMYSGREETPKVAVVGEYDMVVGISDAMEEISLPTVLNLSNHSTAMWENPQAQYISKEKDRVALIKGLRNTLVFGDDITLYLCDESCEKVIASAPLLNRSQRATHLPFMGIRGMDYMLEQVERYLGRF